MSRTPAPARRGSAWDAEQFVAVGLGAAIGALLRVGVGQALPADGDDFPVATLLVNLTGCLAMGLLTPLARRRHPLVSLSLGTGVLGGYTTFSTFALDVERLAQTSPVAMLGYLALTVLGCVVAAAAGLVAAEQVVRARHPRPADDAPRERPDGSGRRTR